MKIEFDPFKNAANIAKHGIHMSMAAHMDLEKGLHYRGYPPCNYGERRGLAYG